MYLSFEFINISYLLYFSESALLSIVFYLLKSEVQLEHGSFSLAYAKLSFLVIGNLSYGFSRPN